MKVYKLEAIGQSGFCVMDDSSVDGVLEEIQSADVGSEFKISIIEMDKKEFENLPEFQGF